MLQIIKNEFIEHINVCNETISSIAKPIEIASKICIESLSNGGKILICGNGGSAADAQHIAAELVGRYNIDRKGIAAIALTTDSSVLTSISNDYGYSNVFERQIEALANKNDVLIGISTGGSSENVVNAFKLAKDYGCKTIGMSGRGGGKFNAFCDINIVVKAEQTARIQELHIIIGHTICHIIESELGSPKKVE